MTIDLGGDVSFASDDTRIRELSGDISDEITNFIERRLRHFFGDDVVLNRPGEGAKAAVHVELSRRNPLFDADLIALAVRIARERKRPVLIEGAVPGTAPASVSGGEGEPFRLLSDTQHRWNSQINLAKLKRVKIFQSLRTRFPDLHTRSVEDILAWTSSGDGVEFVLSYGEDVSFDRYDACPLCAGADARPVHCGVGQPRVGFLTRHSNYYWHCGDCGLVYLNPSPREEHVYKYYDWYDKEIVQLSPADQAVQSDYVRNYERCLDRFAPLLPPGSEVVDLGGGQGTFAILAKQRRPDWKVEVIDFQCVTADYLKSAHDIDARSANFVTDDLGEGRYDLITFWEVVEHVKLERLQQMFAAISRALKPGGHVCFSTPDWDSPVTRMADFWAAYVPQHMSVLSPGVLAPIWKQVGLALVDLRHEALLISPGYGDMRYLATAGGSVASRAEADVLDHLLNADAAGDAIRRELLDTANQGAEMVVTLRKV